MNYTRDDYLNDLNSREVRHTNSREHFQDFYDELGRDPVEHDQDCRKDRMNFVVPKGRILELGCHWGYNCLSYAMHGHFTTGVDLSQTLIDHGLLKLRERPHYVQNRVSLICAWIEDLNVARIGCFETIILTETLEHVIDPAPIVAKAKELLAKDGILYISCPTTKFGTNSHVREISAQEMVELLGSNGMYCSGPILGDPNSRSYVCKHKKEIT